MNLCNRRISNLYYHNILTTLQIVYVLVGARPSVTSPNTSVNDTLSEREYPTGAKNGCLALSSGPFVIKRPIRATDYRTMLSDVSCRTNIL